MLTQNDGVERFGGTYFDAAIDASKGRLWPAESLVGNCQPRYQTQTRHIDRALLLLGLDPQLDDKQREAIAHLLIIPGQSLHDGTKRLLDQSSSRIKGAVVCDILDQIAPTAFIFERLADVGSIVDLWPAPFFWDSNLSRLLSVSFRSTGTRAPPG